MTNIMTKEQLALLTVKEIKEIAKENGLKGYSKLSKSELVEMLAVKVVEVEATEELVKEDKTVQLTTVEILEEFYADCMKFWQREKDRGYIDTQSVETLALNDIRAITTNPFSPKGKALDLTAKEIWLKQKTENINAKGGKTLL